MNGSVIQFILGLLYGIIMAYLLYRFVAYNMKKSEDENIVQGGGRAVFGFLLRYAMIAIIILIASRFGTYFLLGSIACVFYQVFLIFDRKE